MFVKHRRSNQFDAVVSHVRNTFDSVVGTGAAVLVIHEDAIVVEEYWGKQSLDAQAKKIQQDTQFHVASVRKSYIGFAVAYAVHHRKIHSIDDPVTEYLPFLDSDLMKGTTIRHLLTHTHGSHIKEGSIYREFAPGKSWSYRGVGIDMLAQIVKMSTGKTIAQIVGEQVFLPLGFTESGWYGTLHEKLADVIRLPDDKSWTTSDSTDGDKMNMYVSARELAYWGYLHLKIGRIGDKQIVAKEIIDLATSLQSPRLLDEDLPQNGFLWFVKDLPAKKTEIGELVPEGSFQILGYTGVAVLVVPRHDLVAVRMFNSFGSPAGYDYLEDIRSFGDTVIKCI